MKKYEYKPKKVRFRGKSAERKAWVYGYLVSFVTVKNGISQKKYAIGDDFAFEEVIPETIGQMIDVKDAEKNKYIYEGDIILGKGRNDWNEKLEKRFIVKPFSQMKSSFKDWFHFEQPEFRILGNVIDNPELAQEVYIENLNIFEEQ